MIYWAQLFHFYQPPAQIPIVLDKICDESYRPLLKVFQQHPYVRATVNISGVLLEMLKDYGHSDIIDALRELGEKGQVEFTGSGKYHPILPLLPREESQRQIELNITTEKHFLGNAYQPQGFFPPELCFSSEIVPEVIASGHRWIILSGVACPAPWPVARIYRIKFRDRVRYRDKELAVFFRDDILSNKISFRQISAGEFLEHLKQLKGEHENSYVVTAMDAETYGHHIEGWEQVFLSAVYQQIQPTQETYAAFKQATVLANQQSALLADACFTEQVQTATISDLLAFFPLAETVTPRPSSWNTTDADIAAGNPFPLWRDNHNEIHHLQWEHLYLCSEIVRKAQECGNSEECRFFGNIARGLLDRAEHRCQFWWASQRPMWDVNLIHLGLIEQWRAVVNAYRAINKSGATDDVKREYYYKLVAARDLRNKIVDRLFLL